MSWQEKVSKKLQHNGYKSCVRLAFPTNLDTKPTEINVDQLVDVVVGNRLYKPCLYLYNKIDTVTIEEVSTACM